MAVNKLRLKYIPGTYAKKRPDSAQLADRYINEWSQRQLKILAVRIICSNIYRIQRLADILDVEENEAEKLLHQIDQEQRAFFQKAFGKKDAAPYEFDLVINNDFITEPGSAAVIIAQAFKEKFSAELEGKAFVDRSAA